LEQEVKNYCPQACGLCCEDNAAYSFDTRYVSGADCAWIALRKVRKKWCDQYLNKQMVRNMCPMACDFCKNPVTLAPTSSPSSSIPTAYPTTSEPTMSPTTPEPTMPPTTTEPSLLPTTTEPTALPTTREPTVACLDDNSFETDEIKSCKWVRNDETRRQYYCAHSEVSESCPLACGNCCGDDAKFKFINDHGDECDCAWIAKQQIRIQKFCPRNLKDTTALKFFNVKARCPETCDLCFDPVGPF